MRPSDSSISTSSMARFVWGRHYCHGLWGDRSSSSRADMSMGALPQKAPQLTSMHEYGTEGVPCSLPQQDLSLLHNTIQSESGPCS